MIPAAIPPVPPRTAVPPDSEGVLPLPPGDNQSATGDFEELLSKATGHSGARGKPGKPKPSAPKPVRSVRQDSLDLAGQSVNLRQHEPHRPAESRAESRSGAAVAARQSQSQTGGEEHALATPEDAVASQARPTEPEAGRASSTASETTPEAEAAQPSAVPQGANPVSMDAMLLEDMVELPALTQPAASSDTTLSPKLAAELKAVAAQEAKIAQAASVTPVSGTPASPKADTPQLFENGISVAEMARRWAKAGDPRNEAGPSEEGSTSAEMSDGTAIALTEPNMVLEASITQDFSEGQGSGDGPWAHGSHAPTSDHAQPGRLRSATSTQARIQEVTGMPAEIQPSSGEIAALGEAALPTVAPAAEAMLERIWSQVTAFRLQGASQYVVELRPDAQTQLQLTIQFGASGLEIQPRLQQGDLSRMNAAWGELQAGLAERGVQLRPLESSQASSQSEMHHPSGGAPQQKDAAFSQSWRQPEDVGTQASSVAPTSGNAARAMARNAPVPSGSGGRWEGWA